MLNLTDSASAHISEMLAEAPDEMAVRIVPQEQGLALQLDNPREEDEKFTHDGQTILVIDKQMADLLQDKQLDVQSTEEGPQLTLT